MKRILSMIIAVALISSYVTVYAAETDVVINSDVAIVESQTVEYNENEETNEILKIDEITETDGEMSSEQDVPTDSDSNIIDTENLEYITNEDAIEGMDEASNTVDEKGLSEYVYEEIYNTEFAFDTVSETEIELAVENDIPEFISDEELQIQVMSDETEVSGWENCATMMASKSDMSSVVINDDIYTFGGTRAGEALTEVEVFDTETLLWSSKSAMPEARYKHSALYLDGKVYICAGYDVDGDAVSDIAVYDVDSNMWESSYITTPNGNTNYASGIYNGELYIFGGMEKDLSSDTETYISTTNAYKYSFSTNTWTQIVSMPVETFDGKAATTSYGFYILSDMNVMKYNYEDNTILKVDTLPRTMMDYAFIVRDYEEYSGYSEDDVLMISGGREYSSGESLANVKVRANSEYAFTEDWVPEWYNDLRLIRGLSCHNMVEANGYIYVFGGQITPELEQRLMFRRSSSEWHDDNPEWDGFADLASGYGYGSINYKADLDCFHFVPEATGKYEVKGLDAIHTNNAGYRYLITIYNEYGIPIASEKQGHLNGVTLQANKSYMIEISDPTYKCTGNYFFRVHQVYDDAPDTIDEAIKIPIETTVSKSFLGMLDVDCMYFEITEAGKYNIETSTKGISRVLLMIEDKDGHQLCSYNYGEADNGYNVENIRLAKGRYYISILPVELEYEWENQWYTLRISKTDSYKYMNKARYRHGVAAIDGKIYAFGGFNDAYGLESSIEQYTPSTAMWTHFGESENVLRQGTSSIGVNSKIYLVGGVEDNSHGAMNYESLADSIMIYDTTTQQWSSSGDLGIDRERVGLVEKDGNIYIVGGRSYSPTMYSEEIQTFNIETNTLSDYTVDLPNGIVDPQVFFKDDIMYVVGGVDLEGYSDKVYALEDGIWVQKASMPYQSIYLRGKGYNGDFFCAAVNALGNVDILKYDSASDEWKVLYENAISNRTYYGVDVLNGFLYVVGGYSSGEDVVKNDISAYDIVTDIETMDTAIPVRTIGYEYEQSVIGTIDAPEILNVNAKIIDSDKGIYELYVEEDDYTYDVRNTPFFFWSAREGMFTALSDDYTRVMFYADKGTGDRQVKVVVGIGDGRGYVDKKSFLLNGNGETE